MSALTEEQRSALPLTANERKAVLTVAKFYDNGNPFGEKNETYPVIARALRIAADPRVAEALAIADEVREWSQYALGCGKCADAILEAAKARAK